jgi:hypothetical protein
MSASQLSTIPESVAFTLPSTPTLSIFGTITVALEIEKSRLVTIHIINDIAGSCIAIPARQGLHLINFTRRPCFKFLERRNPSRCHGSTISKQAGDIYQQCRWYLHRKT